MLKNSFSSSKRTRNTICSAFCNREKCINQTDFSNHRLIRAKTFCIAIYSAFYRPFKAHADIYRLSFFVSESCNSIVNFIFTSLCNFFDCISSKKSERNKNFMSKRSFWNSSYTVACKNLIAFFCSRSEFPFFILIKSRKINPALKEVSRFFSKKRKRILQSIINLSQKTRTNFNAKQISSKFYRTIC